MNRFFLCLIVFVTILPGCSRRTADKVDGAAVAKGGEGQSNEVQSANEPAEPIEEEAQDSIDSDDAESESPVSSNAGRPVRDRPSFDGLDGTVALGQPAAAARKAYPRPESAADPAVSAVARAGLASWGWETNSRQSVEVGLENGEIKAIIESQDDPAGRLVENWIQRFRSKYGEPKKQAENRHGSMMVWESAGDTMAVFYARLPKFGVASTRVMGESSAVTKLGLRLDDPEAFVQQLTQLAQITSELTPEQFEELSRAFQGSG